MDFKKLNKVVIVGSYGMDNNDLIWNVTHSDDQSIIFICEDGQTVEFNNYENLEKWYKKIGFGFVKQSLNLITNQKIKAEKDIFCDDCIIIECDGCISGSKWQGLEYDHDSEVGE